MICLGVSWHWLRELLRESTSSTCDDVQVTYLMPIQGLLMASSRLYGPECFNESMAM